jgi:hypothetical protein
MTQAKQTILRFVLKFTGHPTEIMSRFFPQGMTLLNRTEWRGKEPRSCAVATVRNRPHAAGSEGEVVYDVEVSYRPKGVITYTGGTKYDGWTAMMLDRAKDGTLLDGHGKPLPEGAEPIYLPFEVYRDTDFNEIDFGEFVGEFGVEEVKHVPVAQVMEQMKHSGRFSMSINSSFVAARRNRPLVRIILSDAPSGTGTDGCGTRIVNINRLTPHLQRVLVDEVTGLVSGFVEGRYSIKNISNDELVMAQLEDVLVDCPADEAGETRRFNCLHEYLPANFLEDLAKQLMAVYEVDVSIVDGERNSLLLRKPEMPKRD